MAAAVLDALFLAGVGAAVLWVTLRACDLTMADLSALPFLVALPLTTFVLLIDLGYLLLFTAAGGQTLGKMAARIRVVATSPDTGEDERLDIQRAAFRSLLTLPSVLALGAGFMPALVGDHKAVHDRIARLASYGYDAAGRSAGHGRRSRLRPVAPGTVGSAVGAIAYLLTRHWPASWQVAAAGVVTLAGVWAASEAARHFGRHDPGQVVIDEVAGQWLTLLLTGVGPLGAVVGFFVFRVLDVTKPWPARRFESLPAGLGIMADDVMVALYGNILLQIGVRIVSGAA